MTMELVRYDQACRALAAAKQTDEVLGVHDIGEAMRAYGRQAKNKSLELDGAEIRIRAERRLGELIAEQKATAGLADGGDAQRTRYRKGTESRPTLADAGITKKLSARAQKLAAVPEAEFEGRVAGWRERVGQETERVTVDLLAAGEKHVRGTFGTGENDWHTPEQYIGAARVALGSIDLDPATSEAAQRKVKAARYYTPEDNGLEQTWAGRVWLNPPYAQPLIAQFVERLASEYETGSVQAAILLTHNYTDTAWFQRAARAATAVCFTRGRVQFVNASGEKAMPTQGQAFCYFGQDVAAFVREFESIGFVVTPA